MNGDSMVDPASRLTCGTVIPCFNEAERLDVSRFVTFANRNPEIELIFVDDGSTDDTSDCIRSLIASTASSISLLRLKQNGGKAEAVRQGMLWASQRNFDVVAYWDADLATSLETVVDFLAVLHRHDDVNVVWGTRLNLMGHHIERDFVRRQIGRVFSTASATAVGVRIRDALCGAKMFRTGRYLNAVLNTPFGSRWIFDVELVARLAFLSQLQSRRPIRDTLYEFPLDRWDEIAGSKLKAFDFVRASGELIDLFLRYRLFPKELRRQFELAFEADQHVGLASTCEVLVAANPVSVPLRKAA
jgi:glycosyltransferase involved in cell wall biosynthesis